MIIHDLELIYIHIPKTGGSTMGVAFEFDLNPHIPIDDPFNTIKVEYECETHLPAALLQNSFPKEYNRYYKVCFVRNTWDYILSTYLWLKETYKFEYDFNTWIKEGFPETPEREMNIFIKPCQLDWITDKNGEIIVDFIGRFDKFQKDLNKICKKIGKSSFKAPVINSTKHRHYSCYYNEESKQIITDLYKRDIEYFGFKYKKDIFSIIKTK